MQNFNMKIKQTSLEIPEGIMISEFLDILGNAFELLK